MITHLVIAIPEGDGTYGWTKPESYATAQELLYALYAGRVSREGCMQNWVLMRKVEGNEPVHVFCDSARNLLGDRFLMGMAPAYVAEMAGAVTDEMCRWGMTEDPQALLASWGVEAVPVEGMP